VKDFKLTRKTAIMAALALLVPALVAGAITFSHTDSAKDDLQTQVTDNHEAAQKAKRLAVTVAHAAQEKLTEVVCTFIPGDPEIRLSLSRCLRYLQGKQGIPGVPGKNGIGTPGPPGPRGAAGVNGTRGLPGASGVKGETGPAGSNGQDGPQGAPGANGSDGAPGADGSDGQDGAPGQDGATGPSGTTGATGPQGPAGPEPTSFTFTYLGQQFVCSDPDQDGSYDCA
jgi:hypothetical protein